MINKSFKPVWIFVYILFTFNIRADVKLPKGLGPVSIGSNHIVEKGEAVEVNLSATIKNGVNVFEFSIFDMPKHGSLFTVEGTPIENEVIKTLGKSIILKYVPNEDGVNFDEFTYRARVKDGKYSSPSKVGIKIIDRKDRFSTVDTLNFGTFVTNEIVTKHLNIKNDSSQSISISLGHLEKFSCLNGVDKIVLKPNQIGRIPIILSDNKIIGSIRENLILNSGNVSKTVSLVANIIRPFVVNSKEVILERVDETTLRSSKIIISNNLEEPIKISISQKNSGFLSFRKKINLSRGSSEAVEIKLNDSYLGDFNSELLITCGKYTKSLKVRANALPPMVIINNNNKSISSEIKQGEIPIFEIPMTNVGGQPVEVSIKLSEGFTLIDLESKKLKLLPEDEKIIQLSYLPKDIGVTKSSVGFQWGNVESFITFSVKVKMKALRQSVSSNELSNKKTDLVNVSVDNLLPEIEQQRDVSMDLPVVKDVKLIKRGKKKIEIFWEENDPGKLKYIVETRVHRLNQEHKMLQFHWIKLEDEFLIITKKESGVNALIKGLSPSGRYTFRVTSMSNDNKFSVPSKPFQFSTIESFDLNQRVVLNSIGLIAGIFLLSFYGVKLFRERRV